MLRTSLPLNYIKRTFRPLYGWTQATPKSGFLDPTWGRSVAIFPGMVVTIGVWQLGPDAEFEVLAPAFDPTQNWAEAGAGTDTLIYAATSGSNQGQLVPAGGTNAGSVPVARLIQVESPSSIIIGGLAVRSA